MDRSNAKTGRVTLAIDLGATNLRVGLVQIGTGGVPEVVDVLRAPSVKGSAEKLYEEIKGMVHKIVAQNPNRRFKTVGASMCGLIQGGRRATKLPNLNIADFDLADRLERDCQGVKVLCANDANCAALSEAIFGSAKDVEDSFYITISSGIGGGYIYQRKLIDAAFEIGHCMREFEGKYVEEEHFLSGNGLARLAEYNGLPGMKAQDVLQAIALDRKKGKATEKALKKTYEDWIKGLGLFFANLQLVFNVEKFVLAGGVMKSAEVFQDDLLHVASAFAANYPLRPIRFVPAQFDQDSGLIGASTLGFSLEE